MSQSDRVLTTVSKFLKRQNKGETLSRDAKLYEEGLGLDSLQTAELSVMLEDELGRDPFSEGEMPQTLGELVDFYEEGSTP